MKPITYNKHPHAARNWKIKPSSEGFRLAIQLDNTQLWLCNGVLHREDGPAVIRSSGTREWYQNGRRHREDGPAVIRSSGTREWYQLGRRHREDGPAVIGYNGECRWWLHDKIFSFEQWMNQLDLSDRAKTLIILRWSKP